MSSKKKVEKKPKTKEKKVKVEAKAPSKVVDGEPSATPALPPPANVSSSSTFSIPSEIYSGRHLTHYDETSGVPISQSEVDSNIRNKHTVRTLIDAYSDRYERLRMLLTSKLFPRRQNLLQAYRKLKENSDIISEKGRIIEKETLSDTERILERLKSTVSLRQSAIQHEMIHIEEELQTIERIVKRVERANIPADNPPPTDGIILHSAVPASSSSKPLYSNPLVMVEVIQEFGDLTAQINQVANKTTQLQTDFPTDNFPRETSERLEIISRCDKYLHAMNVKDHLLWLALQEKEKILQSLNEERSLSQSYAVELSQWVELVQNLKQQVATVQSEKEKLEYQNFQLRQVLRNHGIYVE